MPRGKLLWPHPMHWSWWAFKYSELYSKNKTKKEVERLFLFGLENTIFFFQFIWLQQPLRKI